MTHSAEESQVEIHPNIRAYASNFDYFKELVESLGIAPASAAESASVLAALASEKIEGLQTEIDLYQELKTQCEAIAAGGHEE